jgi:hypothetical protein
MGQGFRRIAHCTASSTCFFSLSLPKPGDGFAETLAGLALGLVKFDNRVRRLKDLFPFKEKGQKAA